MQGDFRDAFIDILQGQYIYLFCKILSARYPLGSLNYEGLFFRLVFECQLLKKANILRDFKKSFFLEQHTGEPVDARINGNLWDFYEFLYADECKQVQAFPSTCSTVIHNSLLQFFIRETSYFWKISKSLTGATKAQQNHVSILMLKFRDLLQLAHVCNWLPMDQRIFKNNSETLLTLLIQEVDNPLPWTLLTVFSVNYKEEGQTILTTCNRDGWNPLTLMIQALGNKTENLSAKLIFTAQVIGNTDQINSSDAKGRRPLWMILALFLKDPVQYGALLQALLENPSIDINVLLDDNDLCCMQDFMDCSQLINSIGGSIINVLSSSFDSCSKFNDFDGIIKQLILILKNNKIFIRGAQIFTLQDWINVYSQYTLKQIMNEVDLLQDSINRSSEDPSIENRLEALRQVLEHKKYKIAQRQLHPIAIAAPFIGHLPQNQTVAHRPHDGNDGAGGTTINWNLGTAGMETSCRFIYPKK